MPDPSRQQFRERMAAYDLGAVLFGDEELLVRVMGAEVPDRTLSSSVQQMMQVMTLSELVQELRVAHAGLTRFGFTMEQILRLKMADDLMARCQMMQWVERKRISSLDDAVALFRPALQHLDHEEFHVAVLDERNVVREYHHLYKGTVNAVNVRAAEVFRLALVRNCPQIILCHNHPSGDPTPSWEDLEGTRLYVEAGRLLNIEVLDHIIVASRGIVSLKEQMPW